jgi:hypothetical protein
MPKQKYNDIIPIKELVFKPNSTSNIADTEKRFEENKNNFLSIVFFYESKINSLEGDTTLTKKQKKLLNDTKLLLKKANDGAENININLTIRGVMDATEIVTNYMEVVIKNIEIIEKGEDIMQLEKAHDKTKRLKKEAQRIATEWIAEGKKIDIAVISKAIGLSYTSTYRAIFNEMK